MLESVISPPYNHILSTSSPYQKRMLHKCMQHSLFLLSFRQKRWYIFYINHHKSNGRYIDDTSTNKTVL